MTVFGSHGRARTDDFAAADVGYVPQGFGHYIENTGDTDLAVVLVLNNATYQSISIASWVSSTPDLLLATDFKVPERTFAKFPMTEVGHAGSELIGPKRGHLAALKRCCLAFEGSPAKLRPNPEPRHVRHRGGRERFLGVRSDHERTTERRQQCAPK